MTGITLPKLRWLVVGAVAAGAWAMTQEPPKREHWQRQRQTETAAPASRPSQSKPVATAPSAPRPSELVTSSIPKPQKPSLKPESLRTSEKVRLRKEASTSSDVVAMLKGGVDVIATSTDGKWRKVSVDGMVGWVHTDYLQPVATSDDAPTSSVIAEIPRPKENLTSKPAALPVSAPVEKSLWGAMRPARAPQEGDCQCPYDLMLNGNQCGDRSAYAKGKGGECYF